MTIYPYERWQQGAAASAAAVGTYVVDLLRPKSAVDLGCGTGEWLSWFREHGAEYIQGVDGDWVDRSLLKIPQDRFMVRDLRQLVTLDRRFDLVISLEVAEHLPEACAETFVASLTGLGPVVLFSAAVPYQGGDEHVNEQWPDYWCDLFTRQGYATVDCLRKRIWHNDAVPVWYRQNLFLFVEREFLEAHPALSEEYHAAQAQPVSIAHPLLYEAKARLAAHPDPHTLSFGAVLRALPTLALRSLKAHVKDLLGKA